MSTLSFLWRMVDDFRQTILTSAMEFRSRNLGVYGIELPMHDSWTAQPDIIDFVVRLFELTTKVVESSVSGAGMDVDSGSSGRDIPRVQLAELASVLFGCCNERLEWLRRLALI
jgi:nuclear pore complex protein Nup133